MQLIAQVYTCRDSPNDICVGPRSPGRLVRRFAKLAIHYVEAQLEGRFREFDLSFTQWIALKVIENGVVSNAGEMARELDITTGATTRLLDTLEEHGLLSRDRTSGDRRVVNLNLTDAGLEVTHALMSDVVGAWSDIFAGIDQAEADAFLATLGKLFDRAERLVDGKELVA
jgi:DNA-binding MarR family transcriptional regulator